MFIYVIVNSETLKIYVGQHKGSNLQSYLKQKLSHARRGESKNSHIYSAMRIYAPRAWSIHPLLLSADKVELDALEKYFIRVLKSQHPDVGYNLGDGGEGGNATGRVLSSVTKAKISEAHRGLKHTPESIAKMSAIHQAIGDKVRGKPRPPAALAAMLSPEGKARAAAARSDATKGKPKSAEVRARMSEGKRQDWTRRLLRTVAWG